MRSKLRHSEVTVSLFLPQTAVPVSRTPAAVSAKSGEETNLAMPKSRILDVSPVGEVREEDVLGLQVAVHLFLCVRCVNRGADAPHPLQRRKFDHTADSILGMRVVYT